MKKRWFLFAVVLVGVAIYAGIERPWDTRPIAVSVETVSPGPVTQLLAVNGRIAARNTVNVRAAVAAQALTVEAMEGELVAAGQVLMLLDTAIIDAQVEQAAAALEAQQVIKRQAQAAVDRARALGANTPRATLEDAEFRLAGAQQESAQLEAALRQVQRQLEDYTVRAPITGTVLSRQVEEGQLVDPQAQLFVIADTGDLVVETDIDELYSAYVREGLKALLRPVGSTIAREGRVVFAAPKVDSATGGREIRIAFDEPVSLPVGLTVNVNVIVNEVERALSLPRGAIVSEGARSHVLVLEDGVTVWREVQFQDWPAERVIVSEGLREGETVVMDPATVRIGERVVAD
ncbi:MAG: efflux RND transporter periplasmic adaptor subunit [Aliihoeflea sp.]